MREAFQAEPAPATLVDDLYFAGVLRNYRPTWRLVVAEAERTGIEVPHLRALEAATKP